MKKRSRRTFLVESGTGLSAVWLAANWPAIIEARESAASDKLVFFTKDQAVEIDAMASQIIPTDDTPGAHEARCVYFIDRALTTLFRDSQPLYIQGIKDLQSKTQELFPSGGRFSDLTSAQQIQLLTAIEKTPFFKTVRNHTITGMFAGPIHGGNYNKDGWKLIGFEDTLNFKPPFGYYDGVSKPGR
ncbi:MAG TPA: gluconate 2-dehydrogenase subunit 3 family protein [Candidatus Acidoferrales bacterium]|nr:gluconate 2-dehydrogenase subunit 3 family protein [Candidatus Acidoferrales bacterium]